MNVRLDVTDALAERTADELARKIGSVLESYGRCSLALSGGKGPGPAFRLLAERNVDWALVDLFQVDERAAPRGHPDRNLTLIERELIANGAWPRLHPMPVDDHDLDEAAERYAVELRAVCGDPPVLDVVHLGLGPDGHTASLVPGDPVLDVTERPVATTRPYEGYRRMTLTFPVLDRARFIVFMVGGEQKADALRRLLERDPSMPGGRLRSEDVLVLADPAAGGSQRPRSISGD